MVERVLAVIPSLNEEKFIEGPLRMLLAASRTLPMRIVIADGGSTDRTQEIVQDFAKQNPNLVFISYPKKRQGPATNETVKAYGDGIEYLIRIDAHANYPEDYCQRLVEEADSMKAASVVVAMHTMGITPFQKAVAAAQNSRLGNGGSAHRLVGQEGMWIDHGHHALMRIDAFRAVGGYDETFLLNEDAELDTRLGKAGYKIWLTGKTSLIYYPRGEPDKLFKQYRDYGKGRAHTIIKHRVWPKLRHLLPAAVLPAAVLGLFGPFYWLAYVPVYTWIAVCLGYGVVLAIKAGDVQIAMAGPAVLIMHSAWSIGFWSEVLRSFRERGK